MEAKSEKQIWDDAADQELQDHICEQWEVKYRTNSVAGHSGNNKY